MELPFLLFADSLGKVYSHPVLRMSVASQGKFFLPKEEELISLPSGSSLFYLPYRTPVGFNPYTNQFEILSEYRGQSVHSVAAFLIPAYLRLHHPAYVVKKSTKLPLWAYTACGSCRTRFLVTATRIDPRIRQSPRFYNQKTVKRQVKLFLKRFPKNRLYTHLAYCALHYNCLAAKNLFLMRWEAPLPTTRVCNARCLGCLSWQDSDCVASHQRIRFTPTEVEIYEVMVNHLKEAKEPIVSFGQGCEGEPILETRLIAKAIARVRKVVSRGTINMNTNASVPSYVGELCRAGIDSFRVSISSVQEKFYNLYFRPQGYKFSDILKSIAIAKRYRKFVSVNLLVFPGFTDREDEVKSLLAFIRNTGIDMIQFRNLNIDPFYYIKKLNLKPTLSLGMRRLIREIKRTFPYLKLGYFNLPKEKFSSF